MVQQDLSVSLSGKDVSASQAFYALAKAAKTAAQQAEDSLGSMNRKVESSSNNSLRSVTGSFGSGLASWAQSGLAGILGGIAASVTSSVMNVVSDAGDAILAQLKTSVIDYNSTLENATIGFTTMLGSGKAASSFLTQLQDFGLKTPFQTDQLIQLSQQMMGYGIAAKDVIPQLTALGDAAAASGKIGGDGLNNIVLAFEQISARGRVDLGDINQLTSGGVPALKILAAQYHTTTGGILEMIHTGKLMASDALPKLISGIEKGTSKTAALGGMMQKQSGTFQGAISNISDSLNRALGTAFQPVFKIVEKIAVGIQKFTSSKGFTSWANSTGKSVGKAMNMIAGAVHEVFSDPKTQKAMKSFGSSMAKIFKDLGPALKGSLPKLMDFAMQIMPALADAAKNVAKDMPKISKLIVDIAASIKASGPQIAGLIRWLGSIPGSVSDFIEAFRSAGKAVDDWGDGVDRIIKNVVGWFTGIPGAVKNVGGDIVNGLVTGLQNAWGSVTAKITGLVNLIPLTVRKLLGIASPSKVMQKLMGYVGEGAVKGLLGSASQVSAAASTMATAIRNAFSNKQISKSAEQAALAQVKSATDANSRLAGLAKQRAALQDKLSGLKSDRSGVYNDTKAATQGYGDVTGFGSAGDTVLGLKALVSKTKMFTADLKSLNKKGMTGALLTQLVNGWNSDPDTALATANGLLSNPTDFRQILALQSQLNAAASSLGGYAGHAEYDSQVNAAAGKSKVLTWEMQKAADKALKSVAKETHIHLHLTGTYAGTKIELAKTLQQAIRDGIKSGAIPKNWASA